MKNDYHNTIDTYMHKAAWQFTVLEETITNWVTKVNFI